MDAVRILHENVLKGKIAERHGVTPDDVELEWLGENEYNVIVHPVKKVENIIINIVFGEEGMQDDRDN
ncbi:MAG: hypothetical protein ACI4EN_04240 [Butyrivibrio sp.]